MSPSGSDSATLGISLVDERRALKFHRAMNRIIEYQVAGGTDPKELAQAVNALIHQGFQPYSGVSTCVDGQYVYYTQAMVKYRENRD